MTQNHRSDIVVSDGDDGRLVRWSLKTPGGTEMAFQHDFPDALTHHYQPGAVDQDVPIYSGSFRLPDDDAAYDGDVRWRWGASPRLELQGWREHRFADLQKLLAQGSENPGLWVDYDAVMVELPGGSLPPQPASLPGQPDGPLSSIRSTVEQQLGESSDLERVWQSPETVET